MGQLLSRQSPQDLIDEVSIGPRGQRRTCGAPGTPQKHRPAERHTLSPSCSFLLTLSHSFSLLLTLSHSFSLLVLLLAACRRTL